MTMGWVLLAAALFLFIPTFVLAVAVSWSLTKESTGARAALILSAAGLAASIILLFAAGLALGGR
ncbi:hypothetical protein [Frigidibacter oleivorans]|uniref:hypothetical protein n=1 Tax=Frigidibacter oleivorans TaxID=2487129 RepID=UPI000F8F1E42|nr:hypothetical protein [Frigidibacter oleivorans]